EPCRCGLVMIGGHSAALDAGPDLQAGGGCLVVVSREAASTDAPPHLQPCRCRLFMVGGESAGLDAGPVLLSVVLRDLIFHCLAFLFHLVVLVFAWVRTSFCSSHRWIRGKKRVFEKI